MLGQRFVFAGLWGFLFNTFPAKLFILILDIMHVTLLMLHNYLIPCDRDVI